MKKILLFAFLVLLGSMVMNAQNEKGDLTLSPQVGVNFTRYVSPEVSYNALTTLSVGATGDYYFNDRWSLKSGLLLINMGANDRYDIADNLSYLTIPINANWHFGKRRNWNVNFGPAMNFLLKAESEFPDGSTLNIKNMISGFDLGLGYGIGYSFFVSQNFMMFVDYQGYLGFINVDKQGVLPNNILNTRDGFNLGAIFKL